MAEDQAQGISLPQMPGSSGNESLGALSQMMEQRRKLNEDLQGQYRTAQGQRDIARSGMDEAYQQAMEVLKKPVQDNTWLQIALTAAKPTMPWENGLLNAAQAAQNEQMRVNDLTQKNALAAGQMGVNWQGAKMKEAQDLSDKLLGAITKGGVAGGMGGAGAVGKWTSQKLDDGSILRFNSLTNEQQLIPATHSKTWEATYKLGYETAIANENPDPEAFATEHANRVVAKVPSAQGRPAQGQQQTQPQRQPESGPVGIVAGNLPPDVQQELDRQIARLQANPNDATLRENTLKRLRDLATQYPAAQGRPGAVGASGNAAIVQGAAQTLAQEAAKPGFQYLDKPQRKGEEAYKGEEGKALHKEYTLLNDAASASTKMSSQLDLLKNVYSTPNMPEGELGGHIQSLRSGLASLGVQMGKEVGAADMAKAIASNFALHLRTGEGTNLLPGAMSNYEDQLLQKTAPGLTLTNEGRLALIDYMKEMNKTNIRFSREAQAMAAQNKGMLPSDWPQRKARIEKEEMARLAIMNKQIVSRFNKGAE